MSTRAPSVLEAILQSTREQLQRRKRELPLELLQEKLADALAGLSGAEGGGGYVAQRSLREALAGPALAVIAEFKRRSPSAGVLREQADVAEVVRAYARAGAAAISVLTEEANFDGTLEDLRRARDACALPILRKDFIVDAYQLYEARLAGADAVLLIVAALTAGELSSLHEQAHALGLEALVEVHDRAELHRALEIGVKLLGINNRDLRDFSVELARTSRLIGEVPADVTVVSESGIADREQLRALQDDGVHAVLVGELLMRAADPEQALGALLGGARSARGHV